jgi:ferric-dicitrate binding protein FerR (iron transport regulator)
MNEPRQPDDDPALDADALRARDAVSALPRATPEPAYRAGLKAAFASGEIARQAEGGERAAGARAGDAPVTDREPAVLPLPWPGRHRLWTGLAVAAALVVAVATGMLNQGPGWRISGVRGEGQVLLDGRAVSLTDASVLGRGIPPGVRVQVSDGAELDLRAGGVMAIQATGGTDLLLPPPPPRWFARRMSLHVVQGEIRVTTGPAFQGARMEISTPDAAIAVTGTTFAVILEPTGTCVCVLEGSVGVAPRGTPPAPVVAGNLRYIFRDGSPPDDHGMRDMERQKLTMFREAQQATLGHR